VAGRDRKRKPRAPTTAAGLITYFEEELGGIKVRPEVVVALALALMLLVVIAHLIAPVPP